MLIAELLKKAALRLTKSPSKRLDVEILLAHVLGVKRETLYRWSDRVLSDQTLRLFDDLVLRRESGEPVAYLTGHQAFWSLDLVVTKDTLIPRPETELLVEMALQALPVSKKLRIADLGTGCGAIAFALASERPAWRITGTDYSVSALAVAKKNAKYLSLEHVDFCVNDWCCGLPFDQFDAILSNPPYIAEGDRHLMDVGTHFEPRSALISGEDGLRDLKTIISQASSCLKSGGILLLEHGFSQGSAVREFFAQYGYQEIETHRDLFGVERVSRGVKI